MTEPVQLELPLGGDIKSLNVEKETLTDGLIPKPVGYHILIAMPEVKDAYESGILKAQKTMNHEHLLSMVGLVVELGGEAYSDATRFPNGPWCKQGDYVMFRSNSGTRFRVGGKEFRLMNDDSIEAVVEDPTAISAV